MLLLICTLSIFLPSNAQEVRVIDNKGTINSIRNNQVTTAAVAPTTSLEGDVWFDTGNSTSKIYTGTVWVELEDIDNVSSSITAPTFPVSGDIWFDTNTTPSTVKIWDGISWLPVGSNFWSRIGNSGTNAATDFAGTTDAQDFVLKSNNIEKLRLFGTKGQVLINQAPTFNNHPLVIRANGSDVLAFQDDTGTPKWHWNLLGSGLNFVESNVADYRLFLENGGNVGINTDDPEAMLDINTIADPGVDVVPLRIRPNTNTPTGTASGEFHVATDGLLYTYDATRGKWLSVDRNMVGWGGAKDNKGKDGYLKQFDRVKSDKSGWRMIRDGTITAISVQGNKNESYTIEIRKNDDQADITSIDVSNSQGNHDAAIDVDFIAGDYLQCYLVANGVKVDSPQVLIEIAWRQ